MGISIEETGVTAFPNTATDVAGAYTGGADGIIISPRGDETLLVGGQGTNKVFVVYPKLYAGTFKNWNSVLANLPKTGPDANNLTKGAASDHMVIFNSTYVMTLQNDYGRTLSRFAVGVNGSVTPGEVINVAGQDAWMSSIIVVPGPHYFYTTASEGGLGFFGSVTFDSALTTANTTRIVNTTGGFHHGTYEPFTGKVYTWGATFVNQHDAV